MVRIIPWLLMSLCLLTEACATRWVLRDAPQKCQNMCGSWNMDIAAIVGVGDQDPFVNQGATACVCTPKNQKIGNVQPHELGVAAITAIPEVLQKRQEEENQQYQTWMLPVR